jgi:hypothetical protein
MSDRERAEKDLPPEEISQETTGYWKKLNPGNSFPHSPPGDDGEHFRKLLWKKKFRYL